MINLLNEKLNIIKNQTGLEIKRTSDVFFDGDFYQSERYTYFKVNGNVLYIDGATEKDRITVNLIKQLIRSIEPEENSLLEMLKGSSGDDSIKRYIEKNKIAPCEITVMLIEVSAEKSAECLEFIKNYSSNENDVIFLAEEGIICYIKFFDKDFLAYRSVKEYANYLKNSLFEETAIKVVIAIGSSVKSFNDAPISYKEAVKTLSYVKKFGLSGDVYSVLEFLQVAVLEKLSSDTKKRYFETIPQGVISVFHDKELLVTAETFIETDLNVCDTARKLYVHRNTLNYRLDKIYKETGLNLRNFADASTFKLYTYIYKLF